MANYITLLRTLLSFAVVAMLHVRRSRVARSGRSAPTRPAL